MEVCVRNGRTAVQTQLFPARNVAAAPPAPAVAASAPIIAAPVAAAQPSATVPQIPPIPPADFTHLLTQYGATAAAAVTGAQNNTASYIYQPLAAVLPYGAFCLLPSFWTALFQIRFVSVIFS